MSGREQSGARPGRIWILVALAFGAIGLLVGIYNLSTREADVTYQKVVGVNEMRQAFGGVEQEGDRLGPDDAPLQAEVFMDPQDAGSREGYLNTIPELVTTMVRSGDLQLRLRNRSLNANETEISFFGIEAAAAQDRGWQFADLVFRNQKQAEAKGRVDREFLLGLAESIEGLDPEQWEEDFDASLAEGSPVAKRLHEQDQLATKFGIRTATGLVVSGQGGSETVQDDPDLDQIRAALDAVR